MTSKSKRKEVRVNPRIQRIDCICYRRIARIMLKGLEIGLLIEETNSAGEFDWVIQPNYENIKLIEPVEFPGIDLDLHRKEYIRRYHPVIVTQRTLPDNRDGLHEELDKLGLTSNDRYEYMCRTHGLCGNNDITIERVGEGPV